MIAADKAFYVKYYSSTWALWHQRPAAEKLSPQCSPIYLQLTQFIWTVLDNRVLLGKFSHFESGEIEKQSYLIHILCSLNFFYWMVVELPIELSKQTNKQKYKMLSWKFTIKVFNLILIGLAWILTHSPTLKLAPRMRANKAELEGSHLTT